MLAWKRRLILLNEGAGEVVGVDISENLLAAAQRKSTALNAAATWVLSDILDAPHNLDGTADLVYTGKGAIAWMMDLEAWARVVARLLKSGGKFFIYDGHPLDWVWADNAETYILDEKHADYFSTNPRTSLFAAKPTHSPISANGPSHKRSTASSMPASLSSAWKNTQSIFGVSTRIYRRTCLHACRTHSRSWPANQQNLLAKETALRPQAKSTW